MIPTPNFKTHAEYDEWSRQHMVALNRASVEDPAEWERLAIRIDHLANASRA